MYICYNEDPVGTISSVRTKSVFYVCSIMVDAAEWEKWKLARKEKKKTIYKIAKGH